MSRDNDKEGGKRPFNRGNAPSGGKKFGGDRDTFKKTSTGFGAGRKRFEADKTENAEQSERIAKRLARAGIASRRDAETLIAAGRIAVNGRILTSPAVNVTRTDVITFDGKPLPQAERTRLWLYHKPSGLVTTNRDPEGRPTVFEALPENMPRVMSVGRLDINTEGLLLLTNDGGLARVLELPTTGWLRRYRVRAHGKVTQAQLDELRNGVAVDGVFYGSVEAKLEREQGANVWLTVGLREGKNREVKNILGSLGLTVGRLIRVSFGPFQLGDIPEGEVQEIRGRILRDQLGERLIEESGADFDSPILNNLAAATTQASTEEPRRERREREWISSSPARPKKRDPKKDEPRRTGSANVWMAPGARPRTLKADAAEERERFDRRQREEGFKRSSDGRDNRGGRDARDGRDGQGRGRYGDKPVFEGRSRSSDRFSDDRREKRSGDFEQKERPTRERDVKRPGKRERAELRDKGFDKSSSFSGEKKPFGGRPRSEGFSGNRSERSDFRPRSGNDRPSGDNKRGGSGQSSGGGFSGNRGGRGADRRR